jgi:hypothetical protein
MMNGNLPMPNHPSLDNIARFRGIPPQVQPASAFRSIAMSNHEEEKSSASPSSPEEPAAQSSPARRGRGRVDLQSLWGRRYAQLVQFKETNGHCNVPQRYADNAELGRWVKDQRTFKIKGKLSEERIDLLNEIGFSWRIKCHDDFWEKMCKSLIAYKEAHGHCNVTSDAENIQLARWVDRQRRAKKNGKISEEKIRELEDIGFTWSSR